MAPTDYAALAGEVVNTVADWRGDQTASLLPADFRAVLLDTLPHLLVDGPDREVYLGHLRAARAAPGRAAAADAVALRVPLPTDRILRDGLAGVSDAALGVLATDPSALRSLSALIDESADAGEVGPAWWAAIHRAGRKALADRPLPPPPTELVQKPQADGNTTVVAGRTNRPRRFLTYLPWAMTAAAVVVAVSVWWTAGNRGGPTGELAATSSLSRQGVLGADTAYSLAVRSPADGFVTVVMLPPDGPPMAVYPGFGDADAAVTKGEANVDSLTGKPGTRIMAFVTPTPATDTIRKATDSLKAVEKVSPDTVVRVVTDALRTARHPWVAVAGVQQIP
jgi:hypothetical protein